MAADFLQRWLNQTIIYAPRSSVVSFQIIYTLSLPLPPCSALLHFISVHTLMRHIGPRCSPGRRPLWGAVSGPAMIALFFTACSFPLIIPLFQTSPVVASGPSHSQTCPCFINILSNFLTVGSPCDTFRSLWCTVLATNVNTTGRRQWFQAVLC